MSFEQYEEKIRKNPAIVDPSAYAADPSEYSDAMLKKADWELVPQYTFQWTDIIEWPDRKTSVEPAAPGEGRTIRSPTDRRPFQLYTWEERDQYREEMGEPDLSPDTRINGLASTDAHIYHTLLRTYDDDMEAVRANHVEVVPYRLAIVPVQEEHPSCR